MPLPTPQKGESKDDFLERCMGNDTMVEDFPDNKQRYAVCLKQEQKRNEREDEEGDLLTLNTLSRTFTPGSIRYEQFQGKRYLVAPAVVIREGVFNGALHPAEELQASLESWNGRPLPIYHPKRGDTPVSANSPEILDSTNVGFFFNARWEDGALKGEFWVDIERCKQLGGGALEALNRLQKGLPLEVSTGYYSFDEVSSGTFNGVAYETIRRDIKPDHIALLPNQTGACSVRDGCGAPRVNNEERKGDTPLEDPVVINIEEEGAMCKLRDLIAHMAQILGLSLKKEVVPETLPVETNDLSEPEVPTPEKEQTLDEPTVQECATKNQKQGGEMTRLNELVEAILADSDQEFTAEDRSQLETLSEDLLEKLQKKPTETDPEPVVQEATPEVQETEEPESEELVVAEAAVEPEVNVNAQPEPNPLELFAQDLGFTVPEMRACLKAHVAQQKANRQKLIDVITANTDLKAEDLEEDSTEKLERLAKAVSKEPQPDYTGQGGVFLSRNEGSVPPPPPVVLAKRKQ